MTTWYRTGTIALTNGSTAVTGTGTAWIENTRIGDALHAPDGRVYEVANVISDTSLTLASNFLGSTASGQDYAIQPTRGVIASFRDTVQAWISSIQSYIDGALAGRFGDGTASEPGVSFANDIDTGLRRSGSNELRVVSGGSDRITVDSSGNVGIGTTSSNTNFQIEGAGADLAGVTAQIEIASPTGATSADSGGGIVFSSSGETRHAAIRGARESSNSVPGYLAFYTRDSGVGLAEVARFNSDGRFGIGNTNPNTNFQIEGAGADLAGVTAQIEIASPTGATSADSGGGIVFSSSGETRHAAIRGARESSNSAPGYLAFYTRDSGVGLQEVARFNSDGRCGIGTTSPGATLDVNGSLSKSSGSFKIDHPLPALSDTHYLVHSFVEGPRADNIYRGRVALVGGTATVDLDDAAGMTSGTFAALNGDVQVWVQNDTGWEPVRGEVVGATLAITCRDGSSTDTVSWLVVGERQDQHMLDTQWTDEYGRVTLEPLKPAPEEEPA